MSGAAQNPLLNPISPENLLNPIPLYKELRENEPVYWSEAMSAWFITRHEDVLNCFRDSRLHSNRTKFYELQFQSMGALELVQDIIKTVGNQMVMKDGAQHLRLRRLVNPGFTPQVLDSWRPAIRRVTNELVDQVRHQGHMDVVESIAYLLPPLIIAELFGIPTEDRERFQSWAAPLAQFFSPTAGMDLMTQARLANDALVDFSKYLRDLIAERRRNPGNDVLSMMLQSQEGGGMTEDEVVANANLMLSAGHLTTTDQLSNGLHDLLAHPEELRLLRENPSLVKSAVEEIIRYRPALPFIHRLAAETFQYKGKTIEKGQMVFLGMASANRDPAVFPDPDRFDISRDYTHQKHFSFAFGPHHCMGAGLARRELEIAIEELIARLPGLRLDETKPPKIKCNSLLFRGFESLPVRW
ncbi:MAG TPA: cytochrome P450 [Archangium sp.]|nr:cytochrome P450 [Archangium sp.]